MSWEPAPGVMLGGKYRLEQALASGGMGSVWVARHTRLDADVAVKLMAREIGQDASSVARFEREAKACAQLQSPHVVGVHDFGVEDGTPYMVMELLRGEDLGTRIDRMGHMTLAEAAAIAVPIGKALRAAHDVGLIHRDLKPRNIFIARQGHEEVVKLVDFGIARETRTRLVDDRTATGVVMGSPFHMSPEQAQALAIDHRADLWALGVVLYRLLTGVRPFEGESVTSVLVTICTVPHRAPTLLRSELPPKTDAFFVRALAKDPAKRFQSARELVDAFVALTGDPRLHDSNAVGAYVPPPQPSSPSAAPVPVPQVVSFAVDRPEGIAGAPAASAGGSASFDAQTPPPPVNDASASHALRAVSTGSHAQARPGSKASRVAALVAVVAAFVVAIVFFVKGAAGPTAPATRASPSASIAALTADGAAPAAPAPEVAPALPIASSASNAASSSSSPVAGSSSPSPAPPPGSGPTRGPVRPAPPAPPPSVAAPAAPAIDPFTGLPVTR